MAANLLQKQRRRGPGRPFEKGQSGNPAGRAPGTRNRATVLAEQLLDGKTGELVSKATELAQVVDTFIRVLDAGEIERRLERLESLNGVVA